mgnify:CR=1 FL=1
MKETEIVKRNFRKVNDGIKTKVKQSLFILFMLCVIVSLTASAGTNTICEVCKNHRNTCWVDDYGAVYCQETLQSYPQENKSAFYQIDYRAKIVGEGAFYGNKELRRVEVPEGVLVVESDSFAESNIENVELPTSLRLIADNAFAMCHELVSIEIPNNVYAIGRGAFLECAQIQTARIPASVRFIGSEAFGKTGITDIYFEGESFSIEEGFLYRSATTTGPFNVHLPEIAAIEEIGDIPELVELFRNTENISRAC